MESQLQLLNSVGWDQPKYYANEWARPCQIKLFSKGGGQMCPPKPDFQTSELLHDAFFKNSAWWHVKRRSALLIIREKYKSKLQWVRTSLVVQWVRIHLPVEGTWIQSLIREDSSCLRTSKPMRHNYWTWALGRKSHNCWAPELELLKHVPSRAHAPKQEEPPQREAHTTQQRVAPAHHS